MQNITDEIKSKECLGKAEEFYSFTTYINEYLNICFSKRQTCKKKFLFCNLFSKTGIQFEQKQNNISKSRALKCSRASLWVLDCEVKAELSFENSINFRTGGTVPAR